MATRMGKPETGTKGHQQTKEDSERKGPDS